MKPHVALQRPELQCDVVRVHLVCILDASWHNRLFELPAHEQRGGEVDGLEVVAAATAWFLGRAWLLVLCDRAAVCCWRGRCSAQRRNCSMLTFSSSARPRGSDIAPTWGEYC